MNVFDIRLARASDHIDIARLWHEGWHDAHANLVPPEILAYRTPDHFAVWLKQAPDVFYVATNPDLLGFVSVKEAEIVKLYVANHARGTGAAQDLLSYAERLLRENDVKEAELFCTAGNLRAEKFYRRENWLLSRTFDDALWVPEGVNEKVEVSTHRFCKTL
ncbi:GNAT family N-acetyltransferase [Agrobacterium rhizogenes]|nr:GNAT family N-acetyltransferase [Rhizobium rhizogenes]NTH64427.1 GNAT family N-acetyltransferase [Rhizobium rhizogenes]NTJ32107.1 GNAT family N-acetyltransferase [Rhizobium rhizogenes]